MFIVMYNVFKLNLESGYTEKFTVDEMIAQLFQPEWGERHNRNITKKVQDGRFRYKAA